MFAGNLCNHDNSIGRNEGLQNCQFAYFLTTSWGGISDRERGDPQWGTPTNPDMCPNPVDQMMLWDGELDTACCQEDPFVWQSMNDLAPFWNVWGLGSWFGPGWVPWGGYGGRGCVTVTPVLRHNNGMNVAFFDGHAARTGEGASEAVSGRNQMCHDPWDWDNYDLY